jgi:hypothetical protein
MSVSVRRRIRLLGGLLDRAGPAFLNGGRTDIQQNDQK